MEKVLITGGAGFIGSNFTRTLLAQNIKVVCIDNFNDFYNPKIKYDNISEFEKNMNYNYIVGDIRDIKLMDNLFMNHKFDAVINLAAMAGVRPSIENPILYEDVNVKGFQVLLECMKKYEIKKLVAASSSSVYGNNKKIPFSETDNVDYAISPYAATKKSNEVMAHVYHNLYNFDIIMLRFFTVYGPGQRPDLAIHKFTKMIDEGKPIPFFGDGSTRRDYTYINDIVDGMFSSLEYIMNHDNCYEIINLGEATPIDLNTMVKTIESALGKKAIINRLPMQAGDVNVTYADIQKAQKLLNYKPHTSFDEGISAFIEWYKKVK